MTETLIDVGELPTLDCQTAIRLLNEAVIMRGSDFLYSSIDVNHVINGAVARYWITEQNKPGCIVGAALYKHGVSADVLKIIDDYHGDMSSVPAANLRMYLKFISPMAVYIFITAQVAQDVNQPWGVAFTRATNTHTFFHPAGGYCKKDAEAVR